MQMRNPLLIKTMVIEKKSAMRNLQRNQWKKKEKKLFVVEYLELSGVRSIEAQGESADGRLGPQDATRPVSQG